MSQIISIKYVQVRGMGSLDQLCEVHIDKPSTYVLTPPKLGALREVARNNINALLYMVNEARYYISTPFCIGQLIYFVP